MPHPLDQPEESRLDQMKRFLDQHADEIERWDFGQIRFDWNPGDVKTFIGRAGRIVPTRTTRLSA